MEEIMQVHVVKTDLDVSRVLKENALAAGAVLVIGTVLPAAAKWTFGKANARLSERKNKKIEAKAQLTAG